jgi:hypothetical protein
MILSTDNMVSCLRTQVMNSSLSYNLSTCQMLSYVLCIKGTQILTENRCRNMSELLLISQSDLNCYDYGCTIPYLFFPLSYLIWSHHPPYHSHMFPIILLPSKYFYYLPDPIATCSHQWLCYFDQLRLPRSHWTSLASSLTF